MAVQLGYKNVYRDPKGYPDWQAAGLPVEALPAATTGAEGESPALGALYGWAMVWTLFGVFTGGLALNLTPCVYPLIPITVSYFGGQATRGALGRNQLISRGLSYMLGLAATNSALGVAAALSGGLMGALLQSPIVLILVAAVLVLFAASLLGLWELRLPSGLTQVAAKSYGGWFGSFFMGLTLGVVAAPCIGPFVLGMLAWVAATGSPWLGFLVFFTLSLGLGLPHFFLALFSGQLDRLPRSGAWMIWVRSLMGWVLIGMAAYFLQPVLPESAGVALIAAVALAAGLHLWLRGAEATDSRAFSRIKSTVGAACIVFAAIFLLSWLLKGQGVDWKPYSEEVLQRARQEKKLVVMDFYATWCAPCREMDEVTFHDSAVVREMGKNFVAVKVDLTRADNPEHHQLLREYGIKGVPTLIFLDANGRERKDLRQVGFLPPPQFIARMAEATKGKQ